MTILDLSALLPGPYCTTILGDLGADVIWVERPGRGDYSREILPEIFYAMNRNKKSITVNLKTEEGREIVYRLAQRADAVLEGFRPGVVDRLGVDYETLRQINPDLVYCSISGYGQQGPYRDTPGHDFNYMALAGVLGLPPRLQEDFGTLCIPVSDLSASLFAAVTILAALLGRPHSEEGRYIDLSMADTALSLMGSRFGQHLLDPAYEPASPGDMFHIMPAYDIFETSDGRRISVGAVEDNLWESLCRGLGRQDLIEKEKYQSFQQRTQHKEEIHDILQSEFSTKTLDEWMEILPGEDAPVAPVNTPREALNEDQFESRDMIQEMYVPHRQQKVRQIGYPARLTGTEQEVKIPPPEVGEHNQEVLSDLGYSRRDIETFRESDII